MGVGVRALLVGALLALLGGCATGQSVAEQQESAEPLAVGTVDEVRAEEPAQPGDDAEPAADEDEVVGVDLRSVDWASVTWTADCWVLEQDLPVTLSPSDDGWIEHQAGAPGEVDSWYLAMKADEVAYADVTGDGNDNAVFFGYCGQGNLADSRVVVWGHGPDGAPAQLPTVVTLREAGASGLEDVEAVDGDVRVSLVEHDADREWLVLTDWRFDGTGWTGTEIAREPRQQEVAAGSSGGGSASGFSSPSGNIHCQAYVDDPQEAFVRCVVLSGLDPQPELSPCEEWGLSQDAIGLSVDGETGTTCDEWVDRNHAVLGYGQRWEAGPFSCWSAETGVECVGPTGNGFMLSRSMWTTW